MTPSRSDCIPAYTRLRYSALACRGTTGIWLHLNVRVASLVLLPVVVTLIPCPCRLYGIWLHPDVLVTSLVLLPAVLLTRLTLVSYPDQRGLGTRLGYIDRTAVTSRGLQTCISPSIQWCEWRHRMQSTRYKVQTWLSWKPIAMLWSSSRSRYCQKRCLLLSLCIITQISGWKEASNVPEVYRFNLPFWR